MTTEFSRRSPIAGVCRRGPCQGLLQNSASLPSCILLVILSSFFFNLALTPAKAEKQIFSIQVGAYKDQKPAIERVNELKRMGHNGFYQEEDIKGKGKFFRVFIERYHSRDEAEKEAQVLKNLKLISEYSIRSIGPIEEATREEPPADQGEKIVLYLHVSSFKEKANAEKQVEHLKNQGQKAFYVEEKNTGATWFRVYIGEFSDEKTARSVGSDLKKKGIIEYFKPISIDKNVLSSDTPTAGKE